LPFPFTDLTGTKQRPAVVVSTSASNSPDVIVAAITSQVPVTLAADELAIPAAELTGCGLLKPSIVKTAKLVTIHQSLIRKSIGALPPDTLRQVLERVRSQIQPPPP